jgi:hypothetical protein
MRITTCALLLAAALAHADDKEALRAALKDDIKGDWIYDDLPKAFAEAERTGKPLMAVFRCVP